MLSDLKEVLSYSSNVMHHLIMDIIIISRSISLRLTLLPLLVLVGSLLILMIVLWSWSAKVKHLLHHIRKIVIHLNLFSLLWLVI